MSGSQCASQLLVCLVPTLVTREVLDKRFATRDHGPAHMVVGPFQHLIQEPSALRGLGSIAKSGCDARIRSVEQKLRLKRPFALAEAPGQHYRRIRVVVPQHESAQKV